MSDNFDSLETRDPAAREASQFSLLPDLVGRAIELAPGWARHLEGVAPKDIDSRAALAQLPLLRKSDLQALQSEHPPYGGLHTSPATQMQRHFLSPGPIFEAQGSGQDFWRAARALHAAGFRVGDIVQNTFAYHLTPGGWILDAGLRALGCAVIPAGPGNSEQQLQAIAHLRPTGYTGVPDYLKILLEKADEAGIDISPMTKALVSGGALFPQLRDYYANRGISVLQAYATADVGLIAYESTHDGAPTPGMIVDEGVILEIVQPGTNVPVPDGTVGEVVITIFSRDCPMIRFATGDLSAVLEGRSPCGRTNMRIKGWMGRADQSTKVKGMFVHAGQVGEIAKRHPDLARLRLVVSRENDMDVMTLRAECDRPDPALANSLAETLREISKLKGEVELVAPGTLANDGKVIDDTRRYD